ncbi:hypothetical protein QP810_10000 [Streptococcus agalactiae]|uniref:hypothetical protein n=1 Tax=Streptococcus agalactiae TaxID=1311 RepID=UPI002554DE9B|nr:hypothetical protein [Streptococcus agalactiae]MDK8747556.1 hypothetical protein [Streptococcus agalactiae]
MNSYSLDGLSESRFEIANLRTGRQLHGIKSMELGAWQINIWELKYGFIDKGIIPLSEGEPTIREFKRDGLVFEFSKLRSDKDIQKFANKYGMLGIARIVPGNENLYINTENLEELPLGLSEFEPIQLWWYFIETIRKNLKLYRALVNNHYGEKVEIEENLLRLEPIVFEEKFIGVYKVIWSDGSNTGLQVTEKESETLDFIDIGRQVLIHNIKPMIEKGPRLINAEIVESNKYPLGITVIESENTPYLLATIYYDFWKIISVNKPIYICENPNCKLPYPKVKRQKYCSNACKQEHYRIRKSTKA